MEKQTISSPKLKPSAILTADNGSIDLSTPLVMGIINATPDSFSDGGEALDPVAAAKRAEQFAEQGAAIIDIGGESSRPGADPVDLVTELGRVIPVIEAVRKVTSIPISIDTYKAKVAKQAIEAGADIINDISALRFDFEMIKVAVKYDAPVAIMHMQGEPRNMQVDPTYSDCVGEIGAFFEERISFAEMAGMKREKLILDPGIGFGKMLEHNLEILANLNRLAVLGLPILVGASRKSFIGRLNSAGSAANSRLGGSVAAAAVALMNGADIVRVHDVAETVEAVRLIAALREVR